MNILELMAYRFSRREFMVAAGAALALPERSGAALSAPPQRDLSVIAGYRAQIILRWGDALWTGDPGLTGESIRRGDWLYDQAARRQMRRFGQNCDAIAYFPFDAAQPDRGILCVNHEYIEPAITFAGFTTVADWIPRHRAAVGWMQAAQGVSVLVVEKRGRDWHSVSGHRLTRRITANTPCIISGPARGADLLKTLDEPTGTMARGTFANCAGGKTPWGTYLTAEENIEDYFGGIEKLAGARNRDTAALDVHRRWLMKERSVYGWEYHDRRFDLTQQPREPLRHGWIVELDPRDPRSVPRKRTALGRFCHESASPLVTPDGRVVVYMGDDTRWEYVYKFVSRRRYQPGNASANRDLLDDGVLHVARFDADGRGAWLPLVHDERGPLNSQAGFRNQADVLIKTRAAADVLGATPMDRPEDIQPNPVNGRVYFTCTKNPERGRTNDGRQAVDAANPRPGNDYGHIIEIAESGNDGTATAFAWNVFLLAGDPRDPAARFLTRYEDIVAGKLEAFDTYFGGYSDPRALSPIACPDNVAFDRQGRMWVASDAEPPVSNNNGCFVVPVDGPDRGRLQQVLTAPLGAEVCGLEFTPDSRTLFLSIQHPGDGGSVEAPICHWPDGGDAPPRSALIALTREDGAEL